MKLGAWPKRRGDEQATDESVAPAAPVVTRCALCPGWKFKGSLEEGIEAARQHRQAEHPELVGRPRARRRARR
ncbi:MAG TPA: hypothetical protein VGJ27_11590 [Gaiellaceae bacterium]